MGWFSKRKSAIDSTHEYHPATVFYEKNKVRGILLGSLVLGNSAIYIGLISVVLLKPEIMGALGLEPFIQYMMHEAQPGGYKNLVQLSGTEFASYFFYFHAASILIFGALGIAFIIPLWLVASPSHMGLEYSMQMLERANPPLTNFKAMWCFVFILAIGIFLYFLPFIVSDHRRFPPNNAGIIISTVMWALFIPLFQGMMVMGYTLILFRWWPKFMANRKKSI